MFKKLIRISAFLDKIDDLFDEIKGLVADFEKAYEDGKITPEEGINFMISLVKRFKKIFPKL